MIKQGANKQKKRPASLACVCVCLMLFGPYEMNRPCVCVSIYLCFEHRIKPIHPPHLLPILFPRPQL